MSEWDGKDRRKASLDHIERDRLLTQIDTNLSTFMRRFDDHEKKFNEHILNDDNRFTAQSEKQNDTNRYIWIGVGIVSTIVFVAELILSKRG